MTTLYDHAHGPGSNEPPSKQHWQLPNTPRDPIARINSAHTWRAVPVHLAGLCVDTTGYASLCSSSRAVVRANSASPMGIRNLRGRVSRGEKGHSAGRQPQHEEEGGEAGLC
jgi:hypothetical protein